MKWILLFLAYWPVINREKRRGNKNEIYIFEVQNKKKKDEHLMIGKRRKCCGQERSEGFSPLLNADMADHSTALVILRPIRFLLFRVGPPASSFNKIKNVAVFALCPSIRLMFDTTSKTLSYSKGYE